MTLRHIALCLVVTASAWWALPGAQASAQTAEGAVAPTTPSMHLSAPPTAAVDLRLTEPTLDAETARRQRRIRRVEVAGWSIAGASVVGALAAGLSVAHQDCGDEWICFDGPAFGAIVGATIFAAPFTLGLIMGALGTKRRRRAQARGEWGLAFTGTGARFDLAF